MSPAGSRHSRLSCQIAGQKAEKGLLDKKKSEIGEKSHMSSRGVLFAPTGVLL